MLIKAAINGGRTRAEHPEVPVTPDQQAGDVVACLQAGASAIHLHVRSTSSLSDERSPSDVSDESPQSENESLYPGDVALTLAAVLSVSQRAQIGVTTGAWIMPDPIARLQAVAAWEVLPGFASVNFGEVGAVELAQHLLSRGVDVEAGLCDVDAANVFVESGLAERCIRVLLEPQEQETDQALETVGAIEKVLERGRVEYPRLPPFLLHGTEASVWPIMDEAIRRGYDVRVGLEDTIVLPNGSMARNNAELITEAVRRVRSANT